MFLNSTVNINSVLLLNLDRKRASDYLIQRKDKASKIERSSLHSVYLWINIFSTAKS